MTLKANFKFIKKQTEDVKWKDRTDKLLDGLFVNFFPKNIAYEVPCEYKTGACTADMLSFKGYVHRWLSVVAQLAPHTAPKILPMLQKSTQAAVNQCIGGATGRQCGFYWQSGKFENPAVDKTSGAGEVMNALAAVSSLLITDVGGPVAKGSGGISEGNPNAGFAGHDQEINTPRPLTTADKAGAGILTFFLVASAIGTFVWMAFLD